MRELKSRVDASAAHDRANETMETNMAGPTPLPHISNLKPYVPGGKLAFDGEVALMASNENPFGPSPKAIVAMQSASTGVHIYPDPTYRELRETIVRAKGIADVDRLVVSAGSDELIFVLTQCYAGAGDEVLFTDHAFSIYRVAALNTGATPVSVPETNMTACMNALLGGVSERTKVLFLANPNNPTGTMMSLDELKALQDGLPEHVVFVIDGAYAEYAGADYEAGIRDLVDRRDNTVMIRTFSKIYGLAALRLGWGYLPKDIADTFQRYRGPFNVNGVSVAGGSAAIQDDEWVDKSIVHNTKWRGKLQSAFEEMGLPTPSSHGNFLIPEFGSSDRAAQANEFLKSKGILIRAIGGYGLPTRLRVTVGTEEDNLRLLSALKEFLTA